MDAILSIPFLGEWITGIVVSFVAVKARNLFHKTTMAVNVKGKKSFDKLPSWFKALVYKCYIEAKALFPMAKVDELLEIVSVALKTSIKGRLDDIIIDTIKVELREYIRQIEETVPTGA